MFENSDYEYVKYQEMITFISEDEILDVNVYIKRIPNRQNYIMDVYGKKEYIHKFIDELTKQRVLALLNLVNNIKLEKNKMYKFELDTDLDDIYVCEVKLYANR